MKKRRSKKEPPKDRSKDGPSIAALRTFLEFVQTAYNSYVERDRKWKETGVLDRKLSIRSVAAEMGVTHSTILNYLTGLERYIGKPLIDTGTLRLTPEGAEVVRFAARILANYNQELDDCCHKLERLRDIDDREIKMPERRDRNIDDFLWKEMMRPGDNEKTQ